MKRYQRTADGRYRAQPRDPATGRRISITADTLPELQARLDQLRRVRRDVRYGAIDPTDATRQSRAVQGRRLTVRELWERRFRSVSPASQDVARATWERRLAPWFADRLAWELDADVLGAWRVDLERRGFAPKTIRSAYDWLASCYRSPVEKGELTRVPWGSWRPGPAKPEGRRGQQALGSIEELAAFLLAARAQDEQAWRLGRYSDVTYICITLALTGLRQGEAVALAWDALSLDATAPMVRIQYQAKRKWWTRNADRPTDPTKGKKTVTQLLHPSVVEALRQQRDQLRRFGWYRSDGPVFPGLGGAWRKTSVVLKPTLARQLLQRAGLAKRVDAWNTHSLRHTFATLEVNSSRDLKATAARTGHSDLRVLQGYIHQLGVGLPESAVSALPPELLPPRDIPAEPAPVLPPPGALCDLMQATGARVREFERERAAQKQVERADSERPFEELALEWLRDGRQPAPRPKAVTLAVRRAYVRAYNREKYQGKPKELCAAAGRRSERAALGAWGQALKRAERLLAAESEPEPEAAAT